ncbi:fatty acid desaturase [Paenibacillus silvisoli]|uniref:fatty acid desaturase n=1 Tax=Paenibacillus silvisoli TaxID=3110539 RepID=UPI00280441C9|nr:fatty acid desaturase [Paenibacillus silvisoli]
MGWREDILPYQKPELYRSVWQLANTITPFLVLWVMAYLCLSLSVWLSLLIDVVASGFLVRIFILFHDCCHHSFFRSRKANEIVGMVTGALTGFSYQKWRREHNIHHAGNGNLDQRGTGDITTLTVDEYLSLPLFRRIVYRMYRNPLIMFGLGPLYLIFIQSRLNRKGAGRKERLGTYATNLLLLVLSGVLYWFLGWQSLLLVEFPILYLSAMAGIWLFYVQHQFEETYFEESATWNYETAAIQGSSCYKLPKILQWLTGSIGFHHIHHLSPKIPNYHLQVAHEQNPAFHSVPTIGLFNSFRSLQYRLWDTERKKLVGFAGTNSQENR